MEYDYEIYEDGVGEKLNEEEDDDEDDDDDDDDESEEKENINRMKEVSERWKRDY
jgi:hypothetical protein